MASEIDGIGDFSRAGFLDVRDVGVGPNDLGAIVVVEVLDALARVACDLTELHCMGQDA